MFNNCIQNKNEYIYSVMMKIYSSNNEYRKVIELYQEMVYNNMKLNETIYFSLLRAYGVLNMFDEGNLFIKRKVLVDNDHDFNDRDNKPMNNIMIWFYAKSGNMDMVEYIFGNINDNIKDVSEIASYMNAYNDVGKYDKVVDIYKSYILNKNNIKVDKVIYGILLNVFGNLKLYKEGKMLHDELIVKLKYKYDDNKLNSLLISFYNKCGQINVILKILDEIDIKKLDKLSLTTIMKAYCDNDMYQQVIELYKKCRKNVKHDEIFYSLLLKTYGNLKNIKEGSMIHDELVINQNYQYNHVELNNSLISFYGKCNKLNDAQKIFNQIDKNKRNIATYTSLVKIYCDHKMFEKAKELFNECKKELNIDRLFFKELSVYVILLNMYGGLKDIKNGKIIQNILDNELNYSYDNIYLNRALILFYGNCNSTDNSIKIFEMIPKQKRETKTYNALLTVLFRSNKLDKILSLRNDMITNKVKFNSVTYSILLHTCSNLKDLKTGIKIHEQLKMDGYHNNDSIINSDLIYFYSKIKKIDSAIEIFNKFKDKTPNIEFYNSMLFGYILNGMDSKSLQTYIDYIQTNINIKPNNNTFKYIKQACKNLSEKYDNLILKYNDICNALKNGSNYLHLNRCIIDFIKDCPSVVPRDSI